MLLEFDINELKTKLSKNNQCVMTNVPHPVLKGVHIKALDNRILFTTTNLEVVIRSNVLGIIKEEGECIINCETLTAIINKLDNKKIILELKDNKVFIKQGKAKFKLSLLVDKNDFPKFEEKNWSKIGQFKSNEISKVLFSAEDAISSGDEKLYSLRFDNNKLITTDSVRMAIAKVNKVEKSFTLPFTTAIMLKEIFKTCEIFIGEDKVLFKDKNIELESCLLDGGYINYKEVIPSNKYKLTVDRIKLINLLERARIIEFDTVILNIQKDKLIVNSTSDNSSYEEEIISNYTGETLKIKFNPKFLLDFLKIYQEKNIHLEIQDSSTPILIKGKDIIYIFLPMEVK